MRRLLAAASLSVWLLPVSHAIADPGRNGWHGPMPWMGWGGWWFGPLTMVIALAVLILAVIGLWRLFSGVGAKRASQDGSLDILRERFARGEIDEEEFEARRKALNRSR